MMVRDAADEVESSDETRDAAAMAIADSMQQGAITGTAALPALPDKGEIPLLDMRASQQLPKTLTAGGGGRKEVMELHLQVDDVVDQPGGDQVFQQGEFAALDVHLEQIDPASAGLREDDVKGPDAHLLDRLAGRSGIEGAGSIGIIAHFQFLLFIRQSERVAKDSGVGGEALDAMAMETGHRFEKMDLTAVALAHLRSKISLIPADIEDDRIRSQGIIEAQRAISLRRQPESMLGQELILAPVAVIKGGEPPAKLPP